MELGQLLKETMAGILGGGGAIPPSVIVIDPRVGGSGQVVSTAGAGSWSDVIKMAQSASRDMGQKPFVPASAQGEGWAGTFQGEAPTVSGWPPVGGAVYPAGEEGFYDVQHPEKMAEIRRMARDMGLDYDALQPSDKSTIMEYADTYGLGEVGAYLADVAEGAQGEGELPALQSLDREVTGGSLAGDNLGGGSW